MQYYEGATLKCYPTCTICGSDVHPNDVNPDEQVICAGCWYEGYRPTPPPPPPERDYRRLRRTMIVRCRGI